MTMTMNEILARMNARRDEAQRIGAVFASEGSPVRMLAGATRGNFDKPHGKSLGKSLENSEVDKVFAATLPNEIRQAKASLMGYTNGRIN